ncbi:MAG: nascent polypeptide-associated complex protein [Nanoarchaeota archaeon]|nr:nascent polypeptide-associated complex protein [Nanoarchaeota archaeon]
MFPKLDPKKMQAIMSQMGIKQEEIDAKRVIIETDEKNIIINNPSVVKINMQGQDSFQISGDVTEEEAGKEDNSEEDIKTITEKTGCTEEQAKQALEDANGDLTEAILNLS